MFQVRIWIIRHIRQRERSSDLPDEQNNLLSICDLRRCILDTALELTAVTVKRLHWSMLNCENISIFQNNTMRWQL